MHPFETYHHYLVHSNFGSDCTACPHTHKELQWEIYALVGVVAYLFLRRK